MKQRSVYDIIKSNNVIYKLIEQQINYTVNVAYKLYKLKKELDEIELLMNERWVTLFGEDYNTDNFTQEEVILYNATLMAVMDIDTFQLSIEEVVGNDEIKLSLNEVEIIDNFLK